MPDQKMIKISSYQKLVQSIQKEIQQAKNIIEKQTALMYWKIGRHIGRDILKNKKRAGYGEHLYKLLETDLKIKADTLQRSVHFYREYPITAPAPELSFRHYRDLLRIEDPVQRAKLENKVVRERLSTRDLRKIIKDKQSKSLLKAVVDVVPQVSFNRGLLFTYKIIRFKDSAQSAGFSLMVDCGFHEIYPLNEAQSNTFKDGEIVESMKKGKGYQIKKSNTALKDLYTFKAFVQRVIDGDTIWALVDVGFERRWVHQKLRFRGIDVFEIDTAKGKQAKAYIQKIFKSCPFVVIKTYLSDKYDRPLADVFYLPGETDPNNVAAEGKYLNQELLDQGLAKLWK